jgi:hypothetical protein
MDLEVTLEQAVMLRLGNADAGIEDGEPDRLALAAHLHRHAAAGGELHRIGQQVEQHLAQSCLVADDGGGQIRAELEREPEPLALGARADHRDGVVDQARKQERAVLDLDFAGLDARHVEDSVQYRDHGRRSGLDAFRVAPLPGCQILGEQKIVVADDAAERSADLVTHRREELAVGVSGLLGVTDGLFPCSPRGIELVLAPLDGLGHAVEGLLEDADLAHAPQARAR